MPIPPGIAGAWMHLRVVIAPTTVSFYRAEIFEVAQPASSINGYFISHPPPPHGGDQGANVWHSVGYDNVVGNNFDNAYLYGSAVLPGPWAPGAFTWDIPAQWRIPNLTGQPMVGWSQVFMLTADGSLTISKFGKSVTRTISNNITPSLP